MLVVGPNSTCDICLESYTSGANVPHAITCGHVFCQKCLDHLMQSKCPLCRERFSPRDIRKLHVDRDATRPAEESSSELVAVPPQIDNDSQRLLDDIARIVKEGGKINEIRRVIEECRAYYKSLPGNQYTPVRVSCLLLHNLLEAQRKQTAQAEQLREAAATRDEIRVRLTSELEAAQIKYDDLVRSSRDEKETALAIEKSLREHYDQMNNFWKGQMESVHQECRSLREELDRLRLDGAAVAPPRAIELQHFYKNEPKRSYSGSEEVTLSQQEKTKGKVINEEHDVHLSPLAEVTAPLLSTAPSLMALGDDSDEDMAKLKRVRSPIQEEPEPESELDDADGPVMAYPFPAHLQPQTAKIDPIPIPARSRTPPSRQQSTMAMSITADQWSSCISGSKPRDDIVMSSRPPSPVRRYSSERMQASRSSKDVYTREMTELKRRDSTEMTTKDQLVSKLHDLLDSPRPASVLHGHLQRRGELPEPALPRPISRLTTPSRPSTAQLPGSSSTSMVHYPDDSHGVPDRKPLVRASDVAMQLEKERLERLERERRRMHETPSLINSLKDTTNAPVDTYAHLTRNKSVNGGKSRGPYHAAAESYA